MKCEICKSQTVNSIDDDGTKRYICNKCIDNYLKEPEEEGEGSRTDLDMGYTVAIKKDGSIYFEPFGTQNSVMMAGLNKAAKIIIEDWLNLDLRGEEE